MKRLAAIVGVNEKTTQNLVDELREAGVFSETEQGVIYSRRMVRDKAASTRGKDAGLTGGNPDLIRGTVAKDERVRPFKKSDSPAKTARVLAKTGGVCFWCTGEFSEQNPFHVDHLLPVCDGGTNDDDNLVPACARCNHARARKGWFHKNDPRCQTDSNPDSNPDSNRVHQTDSKPEAEAEAEAEVEEEESCLKTLPPSFFHGTVNENPAANDAQNTAPPQAAPPTAKRGSRLSEDWQPTDELRAYATALGLDADLVVENFRNYWSAVPGAKGLKLNWSATFKNSCLASKDRGQYLAKTAAVNGHSAPAPAVRLPEVWDDDEIWAPFCDGTSMWKDPEGTTSRNGLRPSVNGWCLPEAAKTVAKAAKLPHTFNDWRPLIGWLNDGFIITVDIRDVIRSIAARPGYQPPRSLAYFDKAVRSNSTEWDHTREPKAKPGAQFTQH